MLFGRKIKNKKMTTTKLSNPTTKHDLCVYEWNDTFNDEATKPEKLVCIFHGAGK